MDDFAKRVVDYGDDAEIGSILRQVCTLTGMGFAAVACVTDDRWIACQVVDQIDFGLTPGGELEVSTTICSDIRATGRSTFIDDAVNDPEWWKHPTPILYGFKSHVSLPVLLDDGSFYGSLCAIDPEPRHVRNSATVQKLGELASALGDILSSRVAMADRQIGETTGNRSAPG